MQREEEVKGGGRRGGGCKNVGLTLKKRDRVGCDRGDSGSGRYPEECLEGVREAWDTLG